MQTQVAVEGYLFSGQAENKARKTLEVERWHLGKFILWKGDTPIEQVCTLDIRNFLVFQQGRGLAPHSVSQYYKILHGFFRWCIGESIIEKDPLERIKSPKLPELLPKVLVFSQAEQLLKQLRKEKSTIGRRNYLIIETLLTTGLRANELCQLTMGEVHLENQFMVIRYGKGGKQRAVPLRAALIKHLWRFVNDWRAKFNPQCDNLFVNIKGLPLCALTLEKAVRRELAGIGVRGSTHLLRHTFATLYLQGGGDIERLRLILGHSTLSMSERYIHLQTSDLLWRPGMPTPMERLAL